MNSILALRLPEMIGLTILHSLWQITLLWIALVAALRLWPKTSSAVRYALAIATLTLSVLATGATAVYEWHLHAPGEEISVMPEGTPAQTMHTVYIKVKQTLVSSMLDTLKAAAPVLAWLWFAGLAVMGARFGGSFFYLRTLRAPENLTAIPSFWEQELKRLSTALGLRCDVAIATSARISSPLTLGSMSPMILLPAGLLSGLSTAQIEAILVHELYHIKRRDYVVNIAQAFVEVLLFYHPAVWHISKIIREERENCCDDQTLAFCGDAIAYARALTQIQETNILTKPTLAMSVTGTTAGNFTNRIKRLFNIYPNPAQARSKGILAIGFLIVYLGILLAGASVSTAQQAPSVELEKKALPSAVNDRYNTFGDIFSGSTTPVSEQLFLLDGKEITRQQMLAVTGEKTSKIRSIDIQRADTTVRERHVRLIVKMVSKYSIPGESLKFSKISEEDSLQIVTSMAYLSKTAAQLQPIRLDITPSKLVNTTTNTKDEWVDIADAKFLFRIDNKEDRYTQVMALDSSEISRVNVLKEKEVDVPGDDTRPLFIINGTPIDRSRSNIVMEQLDKSSIESVAVYKGQQAIDRYGDDAKDGVIDITLKPGISAEEMTKDITGSPRVQVFPNATNGRLNISFTAPRKASSVKMILIDSDGKVVKEVTNSTYDNIPTELNVDVTGYKKGIYILQVNIDGATSQHRVVVE